MKKIIVLFLLLNIVINVKAETYYSDYSNYSEFENSIIEASDTVDVDYERRYGVYKYERKYGGYYIENTNPLEYPNIDENDYIKTDYSNWSSDKPLEELNRVIETKEELKVRYIYFYNPSGSYGNFCIPELIIYNGDEQINFNTSCIDCNNNFHKYLTNGKIDSFSYMVNDIGFLTIDLGDYYNFNDLSIYMYIYDIGKLPKKVSIKYTENNDFNSQEFANIDFVAEFTNSNILDVKEPYIININDSTLSFTNTLVSNKSYRYYDIKYNYYNNEKIYSLVYLKEANDEYPFIDLEKYRDYYRYRTRDKVVISDELIITNKNYDIKNFILESTISDIKIESDINLDKNGLYNINFILPFKVIEKNVEVDIKENDYIDENNYLLNKLEENKLENEKLLNKIKELQDEIKNINKEKNNIEKENKTLLKIKTKFEDSQALLKEKNSYIKDLEKRLKKYESLVIEYENKIDSQEKANRELIVLNTQKNNEYQALIDENNNKCKNYLNDKNNEIDSLKNLTELLNRKIVNQNSSISYLEKINNENNSKYLNELSILNIKINDLNKEKDNINEKYGICEFEKEKINSNNNLNSNRKNKIICIIIIITIIISCLFINELDKKM